MCNFYEVVLFDDTSKSIVINLDHVSSIDVDKDAPEALIINLSNGDTHKLVRHYFLMALENQGVKIFTLQEAVQAAQPEAEEVEQEVTEEK